MVEARLGLQEMHQLGHQLGQLQAPFVWATEKNQEWLVLLEIVVLDLAILWELEACHWEVHQLLEGHCVGPLL